jgi:uncharacterized membrane protein YdbT with pleckstrin-like domain
MNTIAMNTSAASGPSTVPPERIVWQGTPSQVINLPLYLLWGLVFVVLVVAGTVVLKSMDQVPGLAIALLLVIAVIPLSIAAWKWLVVATTEYELTTQRLRTRRGVFNKHLDELELYRVRDYKLEQPFFLRLFSLSTLILQTSDRSNPTLVLKAIPRGEVLREEMRTYVEEARLRRGVREVDMT